MAIDTALTSTINTTATTSYSTGSQTESTNAADDLDDFMTLLLAQLENQDPTDPVDTTEWTDQLTQYSQLEQQVSTNEKLDQLIAQGSASITGDLSYLGATVEIADDMATMQNDTVKWSYEVPSSADSVNLEVTDENGNVVYSATAAGQSGGGDLSLTRDQLGDGAQNGDSYTLSVHAVDDEGDDVETNVSAYAQIDAIDMSTAESVLLAGDQAISPDNILRVYH